MDPRPERAPHRLDSAPRLPGLELPANADQVRITGVCLDSRRVQPGDLYAALPGANTHGANYSDQARGLGAVAVLTDPAGLAPAAATGLPVVLHHDPRTVLGELSAWVYGTRDAGLRVIGITGTNGKTTMSLMLESALQYLGHRTGVIGTTGIHIGAEKLPSARTTPESPDVHALLAVMAEREVDTVAMEVSSHALILGRVDGIRFDTAVFTNLTQDHLDFHGTMPDYFAAKADLFTPDRSDRAVICVDDRWGRELRDSISIPVTTFSTAPGPDVDGARSGPAGEPADWVITSTGTDPDGSWRARVRGPGGTSLELRSAMVGRFNQANALGALATLVGLGFDPGSAAEGIASCPGVAGRMQSVPGGEFTALVDYAHTPDAVERAIAAVRDFTPGRVITVLGCGGDRDHGKRPLMGRVAAAGSDLLIVTDDNPRSEDPAVIRAAMLSGARQADHPGTVREVADRRLAIRAAVESAAPGDCVLVLGKGHETGQEMAGKVLPFDDREELAGLIGPAGPGTTRGEYQQ